ncbi:unnamed protein product [Cylicocyclus nassatus]|uniref:Neurotransmitter-gated ion-channel ligand-binding domain-containing protein n=1 Tax=Cylicocyclus nassatus TaxID=53992 RepID=A0AA36MCY3_CYLNA|nr:unnamed protein product [Cylicocyclus nassatus]
MRALLLLVLVTVSLAQKSFRSRRIGTEGQVISKILADYDPATRPPVRDNADHSSILVITNIFINRVTWHEDWAEVDLYLRQQWEDGRLQYDVDPREGIEQVSIPSNRKIWVPDTYFSTASEVQMHNRQSLFVEPSGYVRSSQQRTLNVPVTYGKSFPFLNKRSFVLRLASYVYPLEDVAYLWAHNPPLLEPVEVSNDLLHSDFPFEEASAGDCIGNFTLGTYSCIDVVVSFSGSTFGTFINWFLPTLLLVIASWLHFWIHGSWSVPRTISAAVPFFIFAALFLFRRDFVTATPGLCCWLSICLFLTFLSLVEYFVVICCGIRRSIRYTANGHQEENPIGSAKETLEMAYDTRCGNFRNNNGIDIIARVLFPVIFIFLMVFYFLFLI